jgi:hypothetical protein
MDGGNGKCIEHLGQEASREKAMYEISVYMEDKY